MRNKKAQTKHCSKNDSLKHCVSCDTLHPLLSPHVPEQLHCDVREECARAVMPLPIEMPPPRSPDWRSASAPSLTIGLGVLPSTMSIDVSRTCTPTSCSPPRSVAASPSAATLEHGVQRIGALKQQQLSWLTRRRVVELSRELRSRERGRASGLRLLEVENFERRRSEAYEAEAARREGGRRAVLQRVAGRQADAHARWESGIHARRETMAARSEAWARRDADSRAELRRAAQSRGAALDERRQMHVDVSAERCEAQERSMSSRQEAPEEARQRRLREAAAQREERGRSEAEEQERYRQAREMRASASRQAMSEHIASRDMLVTARRAKLSSDHAVRVKAARAAEREAAGRIARAAEEKCRQLEELAASLSAKREQRQAQAAQASARREEQAAARGCAARERVARHQARVAALRAEATAESESASAAARAKDEQLVACRSARQAAAASHRRAMTEVASARKAHFEHQLQAQGIWSAAGRDEPALLQSLLSAQSPAPPLSATGEGE